jgi:hypothetical protein
MEQDKKPVKPLPPLTPKSYSEPEFDLSKYLPWLRRNVKEGTK